MIKKKIQQDKYYKTKSNLLHNKKKTKTKEIYIKNLVPNLEAPSSANHMDDLDIFMQPLIIIKDLNINF